MEIMAKLMHGQVWRGREDTLRKELVDTIKQKVDEQMEGLKEREDQNNKLLKDMAAVLTRTSDKIDTAVTKLGMQNVYTLPENAPEEGEIPTHALSYAQATQANNIMHQFEHPKHDAVIQAGRMIDRKFIIRSETDNDWTLSETALLTKANLALDLVLSEEGEGGGNQESCCSTESPGKRNGMRDANSRRDEMAEDR